MTMASSPSDVGIAPRRATYPFRCSHFGSRDLFAMYYPAQGTASDSSVLICPPLFSEYYRCHFVMRHCALKLSEAGYDVLRFDYRGCGDSYGQLSQETAREFVEDIGEAIEYLRQTSGSTKTTVVGIRFAAALLQSHQQRIDRQVLWDPVWDGGQYFNELTQLGKNVLEKQINAEESELERWNTTDFLGLGITAEKIQQTLSHFDAVPAAHQAIRIVGSADFSDSGSTFPISRCQSESDWQDPSLSTHFSLDVVNKIVELVNSPWP